ncbi:MAG: hypothetical protein QOD53_2354 [Thermoleophilaceae bacterium]|nr:hypothetical protein [Thermoleophilaceae bacterium]
MRSPLRATLIALALLAIAAPAQATSIKAYRGAGSWVDIYDPASVWRNPEAVIDELAYQGVRTLYVETGNHHFKPLTANIAHPEGTARFIDAAHRAHIKVVAWYLPGFANRARDLRRAMAAVRMRTPAGNAFDSFALDIEASLVKSIPKRNAEAIRLSRSIRRRVGRSYPLGAIVPDSKSTSLSTSIWPGFPYRSLRRLYNVFLPTAYSIYRTHGSSNVYDYTKLNVDLIRARTGDPRVPVHVVGGLADGLKASEGNAVVRAANRSGAVGASFYSYRLTTQPLWDALLKLH